MLIKYLKPYWFFAILAPLCMIAEVCIDLMQPKLMSNIVDIGVVNQDISYIISTGITMLLLVLVGCAGGVLSGVFAGIASQSFGKDLRDQVFSKVMSFSLQQTDEFTTGSLITRLTNDVTAVQDLVAMALRMFVRAPLSFIGGIVMMLTLQVDFALVLLLSLPIELLMVWILLKKAGPLYGTVQKRLDTVNSVVQENVSGARVVKAYVREEHESSRFAKANEALSADNYRVQKLMATLNPVLSIVMNLSVIAVIYIGSRQAEAGAMQVGQIMAAVTYVTQVLMSIMMVSMMFQSISRAQASARRISEVLSCEPVIQSGHQLPDEIRGGSVALQHVSFTYPGGVNEPVLQDICLEVKPGETLAVLGATGVGKTTLINLIPRFYDATEGEVFFNGVNVRDYDINYLRERIGIVPQKNELFSGSILDNLRWGNPQATQEEAEWAAKIAQADGFIRSFPEGYQTVIGQKGASLSGGQRQRLAIARAILKRPELFIFDDSMSALDLATDAALRKALRENLHGTTVIMIAQRIASVMDADRIAVLDGGRMIACAPHSELMESCAVYRDIYDSQLRKEVAFHG